MAVTAHVPAPTNVIVTPFVPPAVQTLDGDAVTVTVRPDEAVGATVSGPGICCGEEIAAKVIVCDFLTMLTTF